MLRRDLAERDGELVGKAEVLDLWVRTAAILKTKLRCIPTKVALEFAAESRPAVIQVKLLEAIDDALNAVSDAIEQIKFSNPEDRRYVTQDPPQPMA